eukprot:247537_1
MYTLILVSYVFIVVNSCNGVWKEIYSDTACYIASSYGQQYTLSGCLNRCDREDVKYCTFAAGVQFNELMVGCGTDPDCCIGTDVCTVTVDDINAKTYQCIPTQAPTKSPTKQPTTEPTLNPTAHPTSATESPTLEPSKQPTKSPTQNPSNTPTKTPSTFPTVDPTSSPTIYPTFQPSISTSHPTKIPTTATLYPSSFPTLNPTIEPSSAPTDLSTGYLMNWWCAAAHVEHNCDQTLEFDETTGYGRCYSSQLYYKGGIHGIFPSPLKYQTIQLYHDDFTDYEYNIIIGVSFYCTSHCHTYGPNINGFSLANWQQAFDSAWNMQSFSNQLFYTVFKINHTHIHAEIFRGGRPDINAWTIYDYEEKYYGNYIDTIQISDNEIYQERLKNAFISQGLGDTYSGRSAWFEIQYFAMNAEINNLKHYYLSEWIKYVDFTQINWQYPVSFGGYDDNLYVQITSDWNILYPFINISNALHNYNNTIFGFTVDTFVITEEDLNGFSIQGDYLNFGNRGREDCWQSGTVYFDVSKINNKLYSKVSWGSAYNRGYVKTYIRNFRWIFVNMTETFAPTIYPTNMYNSTYISTYEPTAEYLSPQTTFNDTSDLLKIQETAVTDGNIYVEWIQNNYYILVAAGGVLLIICVVSSVYCCIQSKNKHANRDIIVQNAMVLLIAIGTYDQAPSNPDEELNDKRFANLAVEKDIENLCLLFNAENLNYTVFTKYDNEQNVKLHWTEEEIVNFLREHAANMNANIRQFDSLIVVVSCHGMNNFICTSDIKLIEKIAMHRLFSTNYPKIRKIPRIFIWDCCSGVHEFGKYFTHTIQQTQVELVEDDEKIPLKQGNETQCIALETEDITEQTKQFTTADVGANDTIWKPGTKNPDFLLVEINSSNPGFQAKLDKNKGSYMIYEFVRRVKDDLDHNSDKYIFEIFDEIQKQLESQNIELIKNTYNNGSMYIKLKRNNTQNKSA